MRRRFVAALVITGAAAAALVAAEWRTEAPPAREEARGSLRLYCQFYVFVEQRPRVGFFFDVERAGDVAAFRQRFVAEDNGERTDFDEASRPTWVLDRSATPPRISSKIVVPDASLEAQHDEDIAIELYGYDAGRDSPAWFEASLKNIHFQNLPGKCRQSSSPA